MNRKVLGTVILAAAVFLTTGAASGGCGGSGPGVSAPQVGANGAQDEPTEKGSEPPASSGEHTSAEHTTASPSPTHKGEDHPTDEKTASGKSPCAFAPESLSVVGKKVVGKGHVICEEEPNMLGGTLVLAFSHYEGASWEFVEDSRIGFTSLDIGHELTVSTNCNEGLWLMYFEAAGMDHNGHDFTEPFNWPFPPHRVESCP